MEVSNITCDMCGTLKGVTNHWYIVITDTCNPDMPGIAFGPFGCAVDGPGFKLEHICSQLCLHKRLQSWINIGIPQPSVERKSTLVLNPPLTRDGTPPSAPSPDESEEI